MYQRFCVNCGRRTNNLINGLCHDCYFKLQKSSEKSLEVVICPICGRIFYKNKWINLETYLKKELRDKDFKIHEIKIKKKTIIVNKDLSIKIKEKKLCPTCQRLFSQGYKHIIQLRSGISFEELYPLIKNELIKKVEKVKEGINVYLDMQNGTLKKIYSWAKRNKYNIKITRKLITVDRQSGKPRYRLTIRIKK